MQLREELQRVLDEAETKITAELTGGSGNPWLACFTTRLVLFNAKLSHLEEAKDEKLHARVALLFEKKDHVRHQHGWNPPQEIKDELIGSLKNLLKQ